MTKLGGDPIGAYRRRLEAAPATMLAPALLGLAEVGERGDAVRALPYLDSPHTATRAAAYRCLSSLAADEHAEALVRALEDPSPRVGRAAAAGLRGRAHQVGLDRLLAILDGSPPRHVRRIVIRLLYASDLWAALPPLVQAAAAKNGEDSAWAEGLLETWFARCRGWTSPPPHERVAALREAVEACSDALPPRLRRELAFLLETIAKGSPRERR